jgi:hypothetical protein
MGSTPYNRTVYASPPDGGLGSGLPRSFGLRPHSHGKPPPHFAGSGLCFAKPLSGPPKRHIAPERYAKLGQTVDKIYKT